MTDITSVRLLWIKFALFVVLGLMACGIALTYFPSLQLACLMTLAIWAFCRAYYFAFYVIEHYADPSYRYAGLGSFLRYAMKNLSQSPTQANELPPTNDRADHPAS